MQAPKTFKDEEERLPLSLDEGENAVSHGAASSTFVIGAGVLATVLFGILGMVALQPQQTLMTASLATFEQLAVSAVAQPPSKLSSQRRLKPGLSAPIKKGKCPVWDAFHIPTFDGAHADYDPSSEYWVVKSHMLSIQVRYLSTKRASGHAKLKMLAICGPALQGHKLIVGPKSATWDDQPILTQSPSGFKHFIEASRNMDVVHLKIPQLRLKVQITRSTESLEGDTINAIITMPAQPGQDCNCGKVKSSELLFTDP